MQYTIFIRIVATATINFSLAGLGAVTNLGWLLFEGGFSNFRLILEGVINKNYNAEDWFTKTAL